MIHKAIFWGLTAGALLVASPAAQAVTFELIDNGATYDAVMTTEAGDNAVFAVDMFIQAGDGAVISVANNAGNPYDEATGNDNPPGNPGAILIGGSDIAGACDVGGNVCFSDFSCGGAPGSCVFGQSGTIKLGEINWDGNGTLSLRANTTAVDGTLDPQTINNLSGCQLFNDTEVLAGADTWPPGNPNGIVNACECGDANQDGAVANSDLVRVFNCIQVISAECDLRTHNGDTNNDGVLANADLVRIFNAVNSTDSTGNVCPARP